MSAVAVAVRVLLAEVASSTSNSSSNEIHNAQF